jgi:hypothetical protein
MTTLFPELMEKVAKLNVSSFENRAGFYVNDKDETKIRSMIRDLKSKSFVLRHPWITGIPSLGIAPAIAQGRATNSILARMIRRDPDFKKRYTNFHREQRNQRARNYTAETARLKATQAERSTAAAGVAAAQAIDAWKKPATSGA